MMTFQEINSNSEAANIHGSMDDDCRSALYVCKIPKNGADLYILMCLVFGSNLET